MFSLFLLQTQIVRNSNKCPQSMFTIYINHIWIFCNNFTCFYKYDGVFYLFFLLNFTVSHDNFAHFEPNNKPEDLTYHPRGFQSQSGQRSSDNLLVFLNTWPDSQGVSQDQLTDQIYQNAKIRPRQFSLIKGNFSPVSSCHMLSKSVYNPHCEG